MNFSRIYTYRHEYEWRINQKWFLCNILWKFYFCWILLTVVDKIVVPFVTGVAIVGIVVVFADIGLFGIVIYGIAVKWGVKSNVAAAEGTAPGVKPN